MTLVSERLGPRLTKVAESIALLVGVAVVLILAYASWNEAVRSHDLREAMTGVLALPVWPVKYVMAAGFVLLAATFLRSLVVVFRSEEKDVVYERP